jgi:SAM-dependent methyltransferase
MDREAYESLRNSQQKHWWFTGRRSIIRRLISTHIPDVERPAILEAGCGYGGNLPMLQEFGDVSAFEYDDDARNYAASNLNIDVAPGVLPDNVDLGSEPFDLIAMLDVLEHIEQDKASLETLKGLLKPEGKLLITVPAFPWLWSKHDELHHHVRRYSRDNLSQTIADAGLELERIGYFNSLLFPLALIERILSKIVKNTGSHDTPHKFVNAILGKIFGFEQHLVGKVPMPYGLSLFAIVKPVKL